MIMIGHDMGLLAQLVDRLAVMYAGNIVEIAPVKAAFADPMHPYTQLLIASIPSIKERKALVITEGLTHDLRNPTARLYLPTALPSRNGPVPGSGSAVTYTEAWPSGCLSPL